MFVEFLQVYLPIVIYILLIVLLVIGILIGLRVIKIMDKVDNIAESVSDKVESLNGLFHVIDFATDKVNDITNKAVDFISSGISKIFRRKPKVQIEEEEEDL